VDFTILASDKFGWAFIISEIIILYLAFLVIHRVIERRLRDR